MVPGSKRTVRKGARTVDEIVAEVRRLLANTSAETGGMERSGSDQLDRIVGYLELLHSREVDLRKRVLRIHKRKDTTLFATVGNLKRPELILDVRIDGRNSGHVTIPAVGPRPFRPDSSFPAPNWKETTSEWGGSEVKAFLQAVRGSLGVKVTEAMVQSAAFASFASSSEPYRGMQPVHMFGLPFQFPLPIRGSETGSVAVARKNALGHADVLLRAGNSRLAVLEIKKPRGTARTALTQAVAYAASIEALLQRNREATLWGLEFGARRRTLRLEAWAMVDADQREAVRRNYDELQTSNHHYKLQAWFYRYTNGKLVIEDVDDFGA
jgi:hypothetical protein